MRSFSNTLVPERLKSARERINLTKAEAARKTGLTAASYVRYESGDRCPSPQVIISIAEGLETSVSFLLGETDDFSQDVISIHKTDNPVLFELIQHAQNSDSSTLQRLLTYYQRLVNDK
jgi:transcriptional regulator with XRE-family HTH domain